MAKKNTSIDIKTAITVKVETQKFISYADFFNKVPLFKSLQITNSCGELIENLELKINSEDGLLLPYKKVISEIPFESVIEITPDNILSPLFLAEIEEPKTSKINLVLSSEKTVLFETVLDVSVLPIDFWSGESGNIEMLASYVRPKVGDALRMLADATAWLKKWSINSEWSGYNNNDKNIIRQQFASIYNSLKNKDIVKYNHYENIVDPVFVGDITKILKEKSCSALTLTLFFASCLECAKLNPVILIGDKCLAVGVWLYNNCFIETASDDIDLIEKSISDGVNDLSVIDIEDVFSGKSVNFTASEQHLKNKLLNKHYNYFIDIRRCRFGQTNSLPLKVKVNKGYELLGEDDISLDTAPKNLAFLQKLKLDLAPTKNKQWERKLLDLSVKNSLLNFKPDKNVAHFLMSDLDYTYDKIIEKGELNITECLDDIRGNFKNLGYFDGISQNKAMRELVDIELNNRRIHSYDNKENTFTVLNYLIKKGKTAYEEAGAKVIYLAFGFLCWNYDKKDLKTKYAPLILLPVDIIKSKGNKGYSLKYNQENLQINTTLLEFIKQEFNIDIRGLDCIQNLKIADIINAVNSEIVGQKGWSISKEVYLSAFSFARYAMWNDIRKNFDEYKKNPLISSLLNNKLEVKNNFFENRLEDEYSPCEILTPMTADSSQFSAIAESVNGASFVLHGPPGTGKSQTITNIIANAVNNGKRVLFVAEKQAALEVVKKRLDEIGIGDFCLELHSNKTDKGEVVKKLTHTLELTCDEDFSGVESKSENLEKIRSSLAEPIKALHVKRRLGVSVYDSILIYLKNKNAPEIMDIESSFYDGLTKEDLENYENILVDTSASAKNCGGVYRSPFDNVNLLDFSTELSEKVYCASEILLEEVKHIKNYLSLFLDCYLQKTSSFTAKKLESLTTLCKILLSDNIKKYFSCNESEFFVFFNANRRFDRLTDVYFKKFKSLIDISKEYQSIESEIENWGENYKSSKILNNVFKKLSKQAITKLDEKEALKYFEMTASIYNDMELIKNNTDLAKSFMDRSGFIIFKKRDEFLRDLKNLHETCQNLFMDYNADSFNSVCIKAQSNYNRPLIEGLLFAINRFEDCKNYFNKTINANVDKIYDEDIFDYYTKKASALIDNIDILPSWCLFKSNAKKLNDAGLTFITNALENGAISSENILSSFRKNVYKNFMEVNISSDAILSRFNATTLEEKIEHFKSLDEEFNALSKKFIRSNLISRLPTKDTEGVLSIEVLAFQRMIKTNLRNVSLRNLFEETAELMPILAPCVLMSPITVSQFLQPKTNMFDLVVFDEASQLPTAEAVASIARAKSAIIVGDPKQLPPTTFFNSSYVDEENMDTEDLESALEDYLALGLPEKHLTWHYRSKHESLIAFSNIMFYENKLCTFPSPDAMQSKVKLNYIEDGVYDRGFTKRNKQEADALVAEVVSRLKDPVLRRSSIGIVTFSVAQQDLIEKKLSDALVKYRLEDVAYDRDEPLFIKNLENVQGDERDVILFSVCYGPDRFGRLALNFGPINQFGGWRRLNVAVSRAREEMLIFSSMKANMIDLSKTNSKGVANLKAFLEFAEKGRTTLAINSENVKTNKSGIGKFIARELQNCGYDCRYDVGVSDFKIDVAVVDPKDKRNFILAIMCDGVSASKSSVKDRTILQIQTLKRNNWNVVRLFTINFINNPKREVKKIKDILDKLTGVDKAGDMTLQKIKKQYKCAKIDKSNNVSQYIVGGENDSVILNIISAIVTAEEPISMEFLKKRVYEFLGIIKPTQKADERLETLVALCKLKSDVIANKTYFRKSDKCVNFDFYRVDGTEKIRKNISDYSAYEIIALTKGVLQSKVSIYFDELCQKVNSEFKMGKQNTNEYISDCLNYAVEKGILVRSVSDKISLA